MLFYRRNVRISTQNAFSNETLTPLEKYLKMADGRDAGLRNIEGDSPGAFYEWYHNYGRMGAQ